VKLFFLRHGEADWPHWNKSDDERPLTDYGKEEMRKVAALLERLAVSPDMILTSPLPRAAQTAEIVATKLKIGLREEELLTPGFNVSRLKKLIGRHPADALMIVGHEPDFSNVIATLTGGTLKLSKAGLALVEIDDAGTSGRLLWLFPPKIANTIATRSTLAKS
jgi:phosphohistidine phosphatase